MLIMYWLMASSLLIFTSGLPRPIIFFFVVMLVSMTIAFVAIRVAQTRFAAACLEHADQMNAQSTTKQTIVEKVAEAKRDLLQRPKTIKERLFSLKSLHGFFMTLAWYQMSGRAFVTDPFASWHGCSSYPAFKDQTGAVHLMPEVDPNYAFQGTEVAFAGGVTIGAIVMIGGVGVIWAVVATRRQERKLREQSELLN
eukprot:TRINITY_DN86_c0_g1_i1.p1 TRINITY_DN86_c0_g1~~TRINITY_DN86_c0_g1_i1.p1  ORF type:complete len:197 (+),score=20.68 TRINITY_DN86_c0_g1_i1:394-984(+)